MLPKLYVIAHPKTPNRVVFVDPEGKRRYRHFADPAEAKEYHRELLAKAKVAGVVGLVMDQEMRAEYFAAVKVLDGVSLMTAVRHYLANRPVGQGATLLVDARDIFIREKKRNGRAGPTIASLETVINAFLAASDALVVVEFNRERLVRYLDRLDGESLTIRNHRARLSTFGAWLARRGYIPENPAQYIDIGSYDPKPPAVLSPEDAALVMRAAVSYQGGRFAPMYAIALFAGLRHGEIRRLTWDDIRLDDKTPIIRVGRGKIRGRRAIRVVPIEPALLAWLRWAREKEFLLFTEGSTRKIREVVEWKPDIARHSWISYRMAMINDEAVVAREAGNSPDVIYRHYFQLRSRRDALRYFSVWPFIT